MARTSSHFNSSAAQRDRLLAHLRQHGSISTIEARELLDVMAPAARIMELKRKGYGIDAVSSTEPTAFGVDHRVCKYYLITEATQ